MPVRSIFSMAARVSLNCCNAFSPPIRRISASVITMRRFLSVSLSVIVMRRSRSAYRMRIVLNGTSPTSSPSLASPTKSEMMASFVFDSAMMGLRPLSIISITRAAAASALIAVINCPTTLCITEAKLIDVADCSPTAPSIAPPLPSDISSSMKASRTSCITSRSRSNTDRIACVPALAATILVL